MNQYINELAEIEESGQYRRFRTLRVESDGYSQIDGQKMLNLSSNDYLGLATDATLRQNFMQHCLPSLDEVLFTSSSSRLLSGNYPLYDQVEAQLCSMYKRSGALFFNSGYHANMGILPALAGKDDLILSDKLVHASIIDGIRLSSATHIRFRHCDYEQLVSILSVKRALFKRVFIVTESIFSMDGDVADLACLVEIKQRYNALLYVDEAHAVGARGETGLGLCEEANVIQDVDLLVGTMGKALASVGAYVICDEVLRNLLINKCRTLIFTTALPPINMAWSLMILQKIGYMNDSRIRLKALSNEVAALLTQMGYPTTAYSNIIPVMVGDNKEAVELARFVQQQGFFVLPVRPPAVPQGTSRLRLSLSANMVISPMFRLPAKLKSEKR